MSLLLSSASYSDIEKFIGTVKWSREDVNELHEIPAQASACQLICGGFVHKIRIVHGIRRSTREDKVRTKVSSVTETSRPHVEPFNARG